MSNYNPIYKSIWTSTKFNKLNSNEKFMFLFLLNNEKANQTGLYQILLKQIACECDLEMGIVEAGIKKMIDVGLIKYWFEDNIIYIYKLFKYTKGTIKRASILISCIQRQKELLNCPEGWKIFDNEHKESLVDINESLIKQQSNRNRSNNKNKNKDNNSSKSNHSFKGNDISNDKDNNENNLKQKKIKLIKQE